jgi:hypothetical protein
MPVVDLEEDVMTRKSDHKPSADTIRDPKWDQKQGVPKDPQVARAVEKSSGRYSASEQSEEKRSTAKE